MLMAEQHNLRVAIDWSFTHDVELAGNFIIAMTTFWSMTNRPEGMRQTKRLVDYHELLPVNLQIRALEIRMSFAIGYDDPIILQDLCDKLVELSRQSHNQRGIEVALRYESKLAVQSGDFRTALDYLEESLVVSRQMIPLNLNSIAMALMTIADINTFGLHDTARGSRFSEEALHLFEQVGYARGAARAYSRLALIWAYDGNIAKSHIFYDKAISILKEYKDNAGLAWCWLGLGELCLLENDPSAARMHLLKSLKDFHEQGVTDRIPDVLALLALLAAAQQQWTRAARLCGAQETPAHALRLPGSKRHIQHVTTNVIIALGESTFNAELANGRAMTLDQAVEYALTHCVDEES
jgi:tetratricopeptide (TPR) repeat protein